jgi:hypothetical protein
MPPAPSSCGPSTDRNLHKRRHITERIRDVANDEQGPPTLTTQLTSMSTAPPAWLRVNNSTFRCVDDKAFVTPLTHHSRCPELVSSSRESIYNQLTYTDFTSGTQIYGSSRIFQKTRAPCGWVSSTISLPQTA